MSGHMTIVLVATGYALSYAAAYLLIRRSFRRVGLPWTVGDRAVFLCLSLGGPVMVCVGLLIALADALSDCDKPAKW